MDFSDSTERALEIKEDILSFEEWERLFRSCGFQQIDINLERDWKYKKYHLISSFYYGAISLVPDYFVKRFLASSIGITAKK